MKVNVNFAILHLYVGEKKLLRPMDDELTIPKDFYNFDSGEHFRTCIQCERDLLESGLTYMIEKSIRKYPGMSATESVPTADAP